ncbi:hypothetical protein TNCV_4862751 [Trichonephila clavipes]|nr:hypothetical protein TNCV_4862751 [Trichonephila clavipes]
MSKNGLKQIAQETTVSNGIFLTLPQVNWADIENYAEFLSKAMPDIKIVDYGLFEKIGRLNVYLNYNKLKQLENQHAEKLSLGTNSGEGMDICNCIVPSRHKGTLNSCRTASPFVRTATAGSDVVQSGRPIFDDFFQHLWPYIGNNTANVVFQMVKRLWLIRLDQ